VNIGAEVENSLKRIVDIEPGIAKLQLKKLNSTDFIFEITQPISRDASK
jgi:hypothetical protein